MGLAIHRQWPVLSALFCLAACTVSHAPRGKPELWRDPGNVAAFDFTYGAHGPEFLPQPGFRFEREDLRGTSPKVFITDRTGREWRVKGGREVRSESFSTRLAAALGYYAEPTFFVAAGHVYGVAKLRRASGFIQQNGDFTWASFERFEPPLRFLEGEAWAWSGNPFDGTPQLNGLKILMMLVSNWDNKDARNSIRGSNLGILEDGPKWIYFVDDWGQSLGRWGDSYSQSSAFDCAGFSRQSPEFVLSNGGEVRFGYRGQHTADFTRGIHPSDVAWLMQYLGRISDQQLHTGLVASGATSEEAGCFTAAIRDRIDQLRRLK